MARVNKGRRPFQIAVAHAFGAVAAGLLAAACGGSSGVTDPSPVSCPDVSAVICPKVPPSYKADVQPIFQQRCYGCHGPGGVEFSSRDLSTYQAVAKTYPDVLFQIASCRMPQADAGQLTLGEATTLTEWLQCRAPNN